MTDSPSTMTPVEARDPVAEIDASCRGPLLVLFSAGLVWLALGFVFALIASIKMHAPGFLADCSWLTFGRVRPAALNLIVYGFSAQVGVGVLLWMMARLGGNRLFCQGPIVLAALAWNTGVTIGVLGILAGASTGFAWLEMPRAASPILFLAWLVIGLCALANFAARRERTLYVSQWYLLAALFWFPWIYSAASLLLIFDPVRGTMQSVVHAWFTGNFIGVWLTLIGLAGAFYFIPKLTGRPLHSESLAAQGFWTLLVFGSWSGLTALKGGPVPLWMSSVSTAATGCLLVPVLCAGANWCKTIEGAKPGGPPALRFVLFGAGAYLVAGLLSVALAWRPLAILTGLTLAPVARDLLVVLAFVNMVLLGAIYFIVPRLVQIEWPSATAVRTHFFCSAAGSVVVAGALLLAGLFQGGKMSNPAAPFADVVKSTIPLIGLSTLGWLVLLGGHAVLIVNFARLLLRAAEPCRVTAMETFTGAAPVKAGARS